MATAGKRIRRHSFSSLQEVAKEMESTATSYSRPSIKPAGADGSTVFDASRKRAHSPNIIEGNLQKRVAIDGAGASSSTTGGSPARAGGFVCLPQGWSPLHIPCAGIGPRAVFFFCLHDKALFADVQVLFLILHCLSFERLLLVFPMQCTWRCGRPGQMELASHCPVARLGSGGVQSRPREHNSIQDKWHQAMLPVKRRVFRYGTTIHGRCPLLPPVPPPSKKR